MPKKAVAKSDEKRKKSNDEMYDEEGKKLTLVTKDGYEKLIQELDNLKNVKRREVAEKIKEAISYGDLSENSEYEEAKNEQAFVEGRIMELEEKIKNAKIISDKASTKGKTVQLGSTVHLKNLSKAGNEIEIYTIVGSEEADPFQGRISNESPVGSVLLDMEKGDEVKVESPSGVIKYEIVKLD